MKWRIEWLAQVSAENIIARLPGAIAFRVGECIGRLLWHCMPHRRRIVLKNLRIALAGEQSLDEIRILARQSFIRSVANLVSAVHTAHMPAKILESRVTVENPEVLEAAVRDGSGCLLLPPHMGNWEILARISHLFPPGHELGALYRPLNNPHLDARLAKKRQSEGTRMFSKRDSLLEITRFLKTGGIIGVLADQRAGKQGVLTNFFGRLTRSSPLPSLLIRRCKVPALAISIRTTAPGRWALKYHRVDAQGDTQSCMDTIEAAMRESLIDVFWFQDRWKCYANHGKSLLDWLGSMAARSKHNRHRILIWLAEVPNDWKLPDTWNHPDVDYEWLLHNGQPTPHWLDEHASIHRLGDASGVAAIRRRIGEIEMTQLLPLDFVIDAKQSVDLRISCQRQGLAYISIKNP
jgi:KDO2-lipid IV(A) lauroyltransferase